jgi:hypothetical protein
MRIGAVIAIAADHDACNAVSQPTAPVPDRSRRARIPVSLRAPGGACHRASARAAVLGRGCQQLTPALLGVG